MSINLDKLQRDHNLDYKKLEKAISRSQYSIKYKIYVLFDDETPAYAIPDEDIVNGSISFNENLQNGQRRDFSFELHNHNSKYTPAVNSQRGYYQVFYSKEILADYLLTESGLSVLSTEALEGFMDEDSSVSIEDVLHKNHINNSRYTRTPLWGIVRFSIEIGISYRNEVIWIPKGVYVLNTMSLSPLSAENKVSVKLKDKFSLLEGNTGKLLTPAEIPTGVNIGTAIRDFLRTDLGNGTLLDIQSTIIHPSLLNKTTQASIKKEAGDTVSSLIEDLSLQANAEYYYNEEGNFVLYPVQDVILDQNKPICYTIHNLNEIIDVNLDYSWEEAVNMIKVVGNNMESDVFYALAVNNDPRSPISVDNIGKRLGDIVTDANVFSNSLALDIGRFKLRQNSLSCLTVSLVVAFNPLIRLDQLLKIEVNDPNIEDNSFIVKSISYSDKSIEMNVGTTNIQNLTFLTAGDEGYAY